MGVGVRVGDLRSTAISNPQPVVLFPPWGLELSKVPHDPLCGWGHPVIIFLPIMVLVQSRSVDSKLVSFADSFLKQL